MSYRIHNLIITSLTFLFLGISSLGAQHLIIEQSTIIHNDEPRACIRVQMDPLPKEVKKAWRDYLDDNHDIDLKGIGFLSNKDMLSAEGVNFSEISSKELSLYTEVIEQGNFTEMRVFAALGHDIYLNETDYPLEFNRLQNTVEAFIGSYLPNHYQTLVAETEEELQDLTERQEDLTEDIADNREDIAKLEKENLEKTKELTEVENQIRSMNNILQARREKLQQVDRKIINQKLK